MRNLTAHFTLDELIRNSGASSVPDHILVNAQQTARVLEAVRAQLGNVPLVVGSWYRAPLRNQAVGGSPTSAHVQGFGVDFNVPGMTPREVLAKLAPVARTLRIDQLIDERDHVHLSADPRARGEVLTEPVEGTYLPFSAAPADATRVAPRSATPKAQLPVPEGSGANAKALAWVGIIGAIVEIVRRILTESGK